MSHDGKGFYVAVAFCFAKQRRVFMEASVITLLFLLFAVVMFVWEKISARRNIHDRLYGSRRLRRA